MEIKLVTNRPPSVTIRMRSLLGVCCVRQVADHIYLTLMIGMDNQLYGNLSLLLDITLNNTANEP